VIGEIETMTGATGTTNVMTAATIGTVVTTMTVMTAATNGMIVTMTTAMTAATNGTIVTTTTGVTGTADGMIVTTIGMTGAIDKLLQQKKEARRASPLHGFTPFAVPLAR